MIICDGFAGAGGEIRRGVIESLGHTYITFDNDPKFNCTMTADIMFMEELPQADFYWMSPPCNKWSVSNIGRYWNKDHTPKTIWENGVDTGILSEDGIEAMSAIKMVKKTLHLLMATGKPWSLENPVGKLRKMSFMKRYNRNTVTYCQYGHKSMKPTDIWYYGFDWVSRPKCKRGDPCHIRAPRGSDTSIQGMKDPAKKAVVPLELWLEVIGAVEASTKRVSKESGENKNEKR